MLVGILGVALSAVAWAAPSEVEDYKWAAGAWKCAGQILGDKPHAFTAKMNVTREMDGAAYMERWVDNKSAEHPEPYMVTYLWTYDAKNKKYARAGVDSGANVLTSTSTGWQDGKWTWESPGFNIVITDHSEHHFNVGVDVQKDGSNWTRVAEAGCSK